MARIYTKTGDDGTTGLPGGKRVKKNDPVIDRAGEIDELNAALGLCAAVADESLVAQIRAVQEDLFLIGSHLAATEPVANLPALDEKMVTRLETEIDVTDPTLPPLRNFILPGGSELAARLHLARTICRRAERRVVESSRENPVADVIVRYLNRLSDWLFVQARSVNVQTGVPDVIWNPRGG